MRETDAELTAPEAVDPEGHVGRLQARAMRCLRRIGRDINYLHGLAATIPDGFVPAPVALFLEQNRDYQKITEAFPAGEAAKRAANGGYCTTNSPECP